MSRASSGARMVAALLLTLTCAACGTIRPASLSRDLPAKPAGLTYSGEVPAVKKGDDFRERFAVARGELKACIATGRESDAWYRRLRKRYRGER